MAKRFLHLFILSSLIGCSVLASPDEYQNRINAFTNNVFASAAIPFPQDRYSSIEQLVSHQGNPDRFTEIPDWPTTREGDYWIGIEYPNKYLQYYYSSLNRAYLVRSRRFFSNDWAYKYNIRIGMTEEELLQVLGRKNKRKYFEHQIEIWYSPTNKMEQLGFFFSYQHILEEIEIRNLSEQNE